MTKGKPSGKLESVTNPNARGFPIATIPDVSSAVWQTLVTAADHAARRSGFTQRCSKLSAAAFVQTLVLGWLHQPDASVGQLAQMAANRQVFLSPQGLDQRFTPAAATLLQQVLGAALTQAVTADPAAVPLLARFTAVVLEDSTTIALPPALAAVWRGCGGSTNQGDAALKLQVRLDVLGGGLVGVALGHGRDADQRTPLARHPLPAGALLLRDLGYFAVAALREVAEQDAFFLTRLHPQTAIYDDQDGTRLVLRDLLERACAQPAVVLDRTVRLGQREQVPVRLVAVRVPAKVAALRRARLVEHARSKGEPVSQQALTLADWTVLVTNVGPDVLRAAEALLLLAVRWQIELLFKLWKQHGPLDAWRTARPERILCEVYAKLIGMVLQHWATAVGCWARAGRSMVQAAQAVRSYAVPLALALDDRQALTHVLHRLAQTLAHSCRLNPRRTHPNTYQRLLDLPPLLA
jgi:hypothetical protein